MRNRLRLIPVGLLSLAAALTGGAEPAASQSGQGSAGGGQLDTPISRDRAAAIARSETGGQVLGIRLREGKRPRYRVKMLLDGKRVRSILIDAQSGAVVR